MQCADFLASPLNVGMRDILEAAVSTCPAPLACDNFKDLQQLLDTVINPDCCGNPGQDCSSGVPATCDAGCATVLLPFQAACATFLSLPMNSGMKSIIDVTANSCAADHAVHHHHRRRPRPTILQAASRNLSDVRR